MPPYGRGRNEPFLSVNRCISLLWNPLSVLCTPHRRRLPEDNTLAGAGNTGFFLTLPHGATEGQGWYLCYGFVTPPFRRK